METSKVCLWLSVAAVAIFAAACQSSQDQPSKSEQPKSDDKAQAPTDSKAKDADCDKRVTVVIEGPQALAEQTDSRVTTKYETRMLDPVLEEIREKNKKEVEEQNQKTGEIRDRQKAEHEKERKERLGLESELPKEARPKSIDDFEVIPHLPPVPQYMTGTCWSFAATSFVESEVLRTSEQKIKLAEMYSVYHEYLAKTERFVEERSDSHFGEGSEGNAIFRIISSNGAVPLEAYTGTVGEDGRHNHVHMVEELEDLLHYFDQRDHWDKATARSMCRVILNRYLGDPPQNFRYGGVEHDPISFLKEKLKIDPGDYVNFMSTLKTPFYTMGELEVPDNWWHSEEYHNLPLGEFYDGIKGALEAGFSVVVAIDVSEPGKSAKTDTMFIPPYDIPSGNIDQLAREFRLENESTTDDHAVHLVGITEIDGRDWFLAKDSGRGARHGKVEGYYFVRDDYVRLKVLAFMVHKDAVSEPLGKF